MVGGRRNLKRALWALLAALIVGAMALMLDPLGSFNALMPKDRGSVRVAENVAYGAGERLRLDVYAPRAAADRPRPVILFFYGGSWNSGRRQGYAFAARALAAQGFVVVVPDYRLVPEVRYPAFLQDCAAAVHWARGHAQAYGGDGERIVLTGHSAGAYNAAMLALDSNLLGADRAAVRGLAGLAGPYDFLPLDDASTIGAFGQWRRPADTQPIRYAAAGAPPVLLLHGAADTRVKPRNSKALAARLKDAGADVRLKLYPGLGHVGILTALAIPFRRQAPVLADVAAFAREVTLENPAPQPFRKAVKSHSMSPCDIRLAVKQYITYRLTIRNEETAVSDSYAKVLGASWVLLKIWRVLNIMMAVAFVLMLLASFLFEPGFREYWSRQPRLDADVILPTMRLWVVTGLPMFAAIHIMASRLLQMIETVRAGDPFAPENAVRMRTIAWCLLVVQLFELACGLFIGVLTRAGADIGDWNPSLSGWVAVLLLFVLARVFEEGARIRGDLEAMV